jgi:hypothetical protein
MYLYLESSGAVGVAMGGYCGPMSPVTDFLVLAFADKSKRLLHFVILLLFPRSDDCYSSYQHGINTSWIRPCG